MDALSPLSGLLKDLSARLAKVEGMLGVEGAPAAAPAAAAAVDDDLPGYVDDFDTLVATHVVPFEATANELGDNAAKLGALARRAFDENRKFLVLAAKCKKPSPDTLRELIGGITEVVTEAGKLKDRTSPFLNHATAVAEGLTAMQWVVVDAGPAGVVESYLDGATFYINKIRMEYKSKDERHITFCKQFTDALKALVTYVKANFKMGLTWNGRGDDVKNHMNSAAKAPAPAPAAAATAKAPAPAAAGAPAPAQGSMQDVFGQLRKIDQSSGRTSGLRHVTKDMKAKPAAATVPAAPAAKPKLGAPKIKAAERPAHPPRLECVKNRWFVEYQADTQAPIIIEDVDHKQEVYIYKCVQATIIIKAKVKAMQIDSCTKCKILFEGAVSTCEVVNSKSLQLQATKRVPSVAIDKTDGCMVYLGYESRDARIVTSKSSEMNVSFPLTDAEDSEWVEQPIPEQFVTLIGDSNKLSTEVSDLYA